MMALMLCIGIVNTRLPGLGKYGCAVYMGSGIFAMALAAGVMAVSGMFPDAGNAALGFISGAAIIFAGAAAQCFIRRKRCNKQSCPWGKNMPEEMPQVINN